MLSAYENSTPYSHWDSGLWTRVLAASGVRSPFTGRPFTEAMLAGLAGGIGFMLFTFEYKDLTTASAVTRFHPGPYTVNLLRRSGAAVHIQQTGSAELAKSRLDAALDRGVPAVVRVVRGKLPWVSEDPLADADSVDIAVVSRNGDEYLVDDGGTRLERVGSTDLAQARNARKADKHWQGHVAAHREDEVDPLTRDVVRAAMLETARELLSEQAPPGVPASYAKNFGILGLQTWAGRLTDGNSKRGWPRMFGDPERAATGMSMLHGLLAGKRFSGPGALRPLYAEFLAEVAALEVTGVDPAQLRDTQQQYQELGAPWTSLTELIGAPGDPDFVAMAERVTALAGLESAAAQNLQDAVRGRL